MLEKAQSLKKQLIHLRRTIHQHPELGFEEFQTGALVAKTLADLGVEFQSGIGKTGLVARLGNGNGPTIGIRADMDALPILEANDVEYKSQVPGKMHACGHDAHTTMLMATAMLLKDEPFDGEIRLLFQPSEEQKDNEGKSGATRMIDDGAIDGLDAIIALHVDGKVDRGKISIGEGYTLANSDRIKAKIFGAGGHGAMPHLSRDPLFLVAPVLTAIHGIVSRWVDPIQPAVVTIGRLAGGTAANVIPGEVEMDFSVRSITDDVRQQLIAEIEQALSVARTLGGDYSMEVHYGYPALYNDPGVTGWLKDTSARLIGVDNVENRPLSMGGEDFAFMAQASRGAMLFLGAKVPDGPPKQFHHPEFDIDEEAMPIGAAILAQTALRFVRGEIA
ncbi:MAG: amidohydrolase [Anaerolineae bacterium]|nr:amidohydrolase [Anaerolineae bacterium]